MELLTQFLYRLSFGLAAGMAVTSPRLVTSGFFRNHLYVVLGLNVLAAVVRNGGPLPDRFVANLLEVRLAMAPAYARAAVAENPKALAELLQAGKRPHQTAESFGDFDWQLHLALTTASQNPVFTLILNGFGDLYRVMAVLYFEAPAARRASTAFYDALEQAAKKQQPERAEKVTREAMQQSLDHWLKLERKGASR